MNDVVTATPAVPAAAPAVATPAPAAVASAPVAAPTRSDAQAPAAETPAAPVADVADPAAATTPIQQFTPSLLEEGAKPSTEAPKTPEAKAEGTEAPAPAEEAPGVTPPVPIEYTFAFPDGFDEKAIDPERMTNLTNILAEAKVPQENAQKLLDMHIAEVRQIADRALQTQWDVFNRQVNQWRDGVKADPEIGGSRLKTSLNEAASFIEQFGGTPEERQIIWDTFKTTGAGNRLEVVKMFVRAGRSLAQEGSPVPAPPARAPQATREQRGLARYAGTTTR